jgi:RNA polymerase sigma-70 factor (ECF subfamily)
MRSHDEVRKSTICASSELRLFMEISSFPELMTRLRDGDEGAAFEVFHEYSRRLAGLAKTRLQGPIAAKVDPDDILQSVFRSFFQRQRDGRIEVDSHEALWNLLAVITLRKCGKQFDYFEAACRCMNREITSAAASEGDTWFGGCEAIARDPTPEESARLEETLQALLAELAPRDRAIIERVLAGATPAEISEEVHCSERTVERVRARFHDRLESLLDD